jgi:hypothetical protein
VVLLHQGVLHVKLDDLNPKVRGQATALLAQWWWPPSTQHRQIAQSRPRTASGRIARG